MKSLIAYVSTQDYRFSDGFKLRRNRSYTDLIKESGESYLLLTTILTITPKKSARIPNNKSSIVLPCWVLLMGIFLLDKKLHENNSEARVNDFVSNNILSSFLSTTNISAQCYVITTLQINY